MLLAYFSILAGVLFNGRVGADSGARPRNQPYAESYKLRNQSSTSTDPLLIDVGYEVYRGVTNSTTGINTWRGIRYASAPTSSQRWQLPQVPSSNRNQVQPAGSYAPICPQTDVSAGSPIQNGITGSEDCLFLNVDAPANAGQLLPVMVWIHWGGYGLGNNRQPFTTLINANNNSFIGVALQYRLGAFGFLSSQDVFDNGIVNAGLHDQVLALQWVQQYISLFGGDPTRVTIAGESAGAGNVILQDIAYGGSLGTSLFQNSIAASPFLPPQYPYNATQPTTSYDAFVARTGCSTYSGSKFDCLVNTSTEVLQNASEFVSTSSPFGLWAFLPVTDGTMLQDVPSRLLTDGKINGQRVVTGNNADEGSRFVPTNLTTEADVISWLKLNFPALGDTDIQAVLASYPVNANVTANATCFATNGINGPTVNDIGPFGAGQNQRANNIYAEATFVCPSYWLAEAYFKLGQSNVNYAGYKYQYSVTPGFHGQDVAAYVALLRSPHSPDFALAFKKIWGNMVVTGYSNVSSLIVNGESTGNGSLNPAAEWPKFDAQAWPMVSLNESSTSTVEVGPNVYPGSGMKNDIALVNAYTWEGGRGNRCDFWRSIGARVLEK